MPSEKQKAQLERLHAQNVGSKRSKDALLNMSKAQKRSPNKGRFKKGQNGHWKGKNHSEVSKQKTSKSLKGAYAEGRHVKNQPCPENCECWQHTPETKAKRSQTRKDYFAKQRAEKGYGNSPESRRKVSETLKEGYESGRIDRGVGRIVSDETREKQRLAHEGVPLSEAHCKKLSEVRRGKKQKPRSVQARENIGKASKKYWDSLTEEQKREHAKKSRANGSGANWKNGVFTPNKLEQRVQAYLDENFPDKWRFNTGDFLISSFVPDFICADNHTVIEVFGNYWHRNENPNRKKTIYKNCGFACVVIWEHEFNQNPEYLGELIASL